MAASASPAVVAAAWVAQYPLGCMVDAAPSDAAQAGGAASTAVRQRLWDTGYQENGANAVAIIQAMRAVDPDICIGVAVHADESDAPPGPRGSFRRPAWLRSSTSSTFTTTAATSKPIPSACPRS